MYRHLYRNEHNFNINNDYYVDIYAFRKIKQLIDSTLLVKSITIFKVLVHEK